MDEFSVTADGGFRWDNVRTPNATADATAIRAAMSGGDLLATMHRVVETGVAWRAQDSRCGACQTAAPSAAGHRWAEVLIGGGERWRCLVCRACVTSMARGECCVCRARPAAADNRACVTCQQEWSASIKRGLRDLQAMFGVCGACETLPEGVACMACQAIRRARR